MRQAAQAGVILPLQLQRIVAVILIGQRGQHHDIDRLAAAEVDIGQGHGFSLDQIHIGSSDRRNGYIEDFGKIALTPGGRVDGIFRQAANRRQQTEVFAGGEVIVQAAAETPADHVRQEPFIAAGQVPLQVGRAGLGT